MSEFPAAQILTVNAVAHGLVPTKDCKIIRIVKNQGYWLVIPVQFVLFNASGHWVVFFIRAWNM